MELEIFSKHEVNNLESDKSTSSVNGRFLYHIVQYMFQCNSKEYLKSDAI